MKIGDIIKLGQYAQNSSTPKPIEWQVLDIVDGKALVISKYAFDYKEYHEAYENTTWENRTLRKWLNDDFYNKAFSDEDKKIILKERISADKNPKWDTPPGNDTEDNVFLLSILEANKYFENNKERQCQYAQHSKEQAVHINDGRVWWWLRSPGKVTGRVALVLHDGSVCCDGVVVINCGGAVRPAMWIKIHKHERSDDNMIQDSGDRTIFGSGAVRDMANDKGRCDLLPLDVVRDFIVVGDFIKGDTNCRSVLRELDNYIKNKHEKHLFNALDLFTEALIASKDFNDVHYESKLDVILELSKHFKEGAKKYGERNWERGIPTYSFLDSAIRHYLKWLYGLKDERHDRAFVWNIMCLIWTLRHNLEHDE